MQVTCFSVNQDLRSSSLSSGQVHLSRLDMSDCVRLCDSGLQQITSCCRRLTCLYVRRCSLVTDSGLSSVATFCQSLTDVSVAECPRVTDAGIVLLAVHVGRTLAHLSAAHCPLVGDRALVCLADRCSRLRYVNMRGCGSVTDCGVTRLATSRAGKRPRAVDVSECVGVTDVALRALAGCCGAKLRRLSVRGCTAVTNHGVLALSQYCTRLCYLNVQDCPLVTSTALIAVSDHCRNCVIQQNCADFC